MAAHALSAASAIALTVLVTGCSKPAPPPPPTPQVDVVTMAATPIEHVVEFPGLVQAIRTADVRARVDGIVETRTYEEGTDVKAQQQLFLIDPRERRADYEAAEAGLLRSDATAKNANQVVDRYRPLVDRQAISKQEYDAAIAQQRTSEADVASARAKADRAKLTLDYTKVTAPISGRAGRAEVTEGALVSATQATLMTRIEQLDPIYVNFSQSSNDLMAIRRDIAAGKLKIQNVSDVKVSLVLEDGTLYGVEGHLNFADMAVDPATGTVSLRAVFPNHDRKLLPGQFVRAEVEAGTEPNGFVVPQRAVNISGEGALVLVVGPDSAVTPRPVVLGRLQEDKWVVTGGLKVGDQVIVNGAQMLRPGMKVSIATQPSAAPAPAGS